MRSNSPDKAHTEKIRFGRRVFIGLMGAGALALLFGRQAASSLSQRFFRKTNPEEEGFFRFYNINGIPDIKLPDWNLTVDGLVEKPITINLEQLKALPGQSQRKNFVCVTGWAVKNVGWKGINLKTVIDLVKPKPQARFITFHSAELPYFDSLSVSQAVENGVILAYEMNGQPLSPEQGWPLRLLVPPMYGYKSVKWLVRMEFTEQPAIGFWEKAGYPTDAYLGSPIPFLPPF